MSNDIKVGMYVRCPIDQEDPEDPRRFALGQVVEINSLLNEANVRFHDLENIRKYFEYVPEQTIFSVNQIKHCPILTHSAVILRPSLLTLIPLQGEIVYRLEEQDEDGYYQYYVKTIHAGDTQTHLIREDQVQVAFMRADQHPIVQIKAYELHNPKWYFHRQIVAESMHMLEHATFGFDMLVGSRVYLLPHQIDSIMRTITADPCRFMLADEVGLGKTIEACVIYRGLEKRLGKLATLIIAPESLIHQWRNELFYKFWQTFEVGNGTKPVDGKQLIFPLEKVNTPEGQRVLSQDWDLCILDEAHRLLKMAPEYQVLFAFVQRVAHLLLLSATPIQENRTDYFNLLRLLEPSKYGPMTMGDFSELLDKQSYLRGKVHSLVHNLDLYLEDELAEDYKDDLVEISESLLDKTLAALVEQIDLNAEDQGLERVKFALAYLSESYQFERKILRHRREELKEEMPTRSYKTVSYPMAGSSEGFYESTVHEELITYLSSEQTKTDARIFQNMLSAMYSSPWALQKAMQEHLSGQEAKRQAVTELLAKVQAWEQAVRYELENVTTLLRQPSRIKGRLLRVIDYLVKQPTHKKFVVFSSWTTTALHLEEAMIKRFGDRAVRSFHAGKDDFALQDAADDFQKNPDCRFMICDELGGEGRNFQMADEILHVDLPWSPSRLEQRIGRLDRIGRQQEVVSVVFFAEDTLENDLYLLWQEGLQIFQESLSGLEIVLGEIQEHLQQAVQRDLRFGLKQAFSEIVEYSKKMRKVVEQERYFDIARRLDRTVESKIRKLITHFDHEGGKKLEQTMLSWATMTGLREQTNDDGRIVMFRSDRASYNSMENTLFVPPNLDEYRKRARVKTEIHGSFSRDYAVGREDLIFYAPGDPWFDCIVENAMESARGRSVGYARKASIDWKGFVFTWSVAVDPMPFLNAKKALENMVLTQGYMPMELYVSVHGLYEEDQQVDPRRVKKEVLNMHPRQVEHLGKRGSNQAAELSRSRWMRESFPPEMWEKLIDEAYQASLTEARTYFKKNVEIRRAHADLTRRYQGLKAAKLYYSQQTEADLLETKRVNSDFNAVVDSMRNPLLRLESVAFVWLVNQNG